MIKRAELADPNSCLNRAREDEMVFVLLGRDPAAPGAIRAWVNERIRLGKNVPSDFQIMEAIAWSDALPNAPNEKRRRIPNPSPDYGSERCGHNFFVLDCPYEFCGYRDTLRALKDLVAALASPRKTALSGSLSPSGIPPDGTQGVTETSSSSDLLNQLEMQALEERFPG